MSKETKKGVTVMCYGREFTFDTRKEALKHFLEAMMFSEGSELQRYSKIVCELSCTDKEIVCDE